MARGYKFARLTTAEWAVSNGQAEGLMFASPIQSQANICGDCQQEYLPIAYQVGRVQAHHFHHNRGGIYHFDLFDQRPYVDVSSSKRDLLTSQSLKYETTWLLDLECAPDCSGDTEYRRQMGSRYKQVDQSIVVASYVDVKAVYPVCAHCRMDIPKGRMVAGPNSNRTDLSAVCEMCITSNRYEPYWVWYNSLEDGSVVFQSIGDQPAPQPLSGIAGARTVNGQEVERTTGLQAKYLGEWEKYDHDLHGDYYKAVEVRQKRLELLHEVTMEQMQQAQQYRRDMRGWAVRLADVAERLKAIMAGDI